MQIQKLYLNTVVQSTGASEATLENASSKGVRFSSFRVSIQIWFQLIA